jgi:hypothetical protein
MMQPNSQGIGRDNSQDAITHQGHIKSKEVPNRLGSNKHHPYVGQVNGALGFCVTARRSENR